MQDELPQFVTLLYDRDDIASRIKVVVDLESKRTSIEISANRDGMAFLANNLSKFVLYRDPNPLAFEFDSSDGVTPESPRLVFDFDPAFDEPVAT